MLALGLWPGQALAQSGGQSGSLNAQEISSLFNIVMGMAVLVFILVEGLLIFAIIRYRRRSHDEMPKQVHGNNRLELGWTVGSGVLVIILFFLTLGFYQVPRTLSEDEALTIEVIGNTWFWEFYYPETGVRTNAEFNVPAGRPVVLEISSRDVQHSFWLPELAGKVDAIPGRVQRMWFQVDEQRVFVGQCAEYCGREHYNMPIRLNVLPEDEYAAWMDTEAAAIAAAQEVDLEAEAASIVGDVAAGEALYTGLGCTACHSLDGSVGVGPSYLGLGERAGEMIEGYSAEEYVRESILNPCEFVVEGFNCVMPQTYGDQLSPQDLADLVAFTLAQ
ncbi:MAG: cytochrome c oxidase subunit II [Anaerolineae bacterium]|nr:cytochrome c oxidase subunit II [Anaerolineae bacterium]